MKILKSYNAPKEALKTFYVAVVRSVLEYGAQVWNGGLTMLQSEDIERIQKRAERIMYPELKYHEALMESNLKTLTDRRDDMCVQLIKDMSNPNHKLNHLLPKKTSQIKQRETRMNEATYYNFACKTERFKHSPIVYAIGKYNLYIDR